MKNMDPLNDNVATLLHQSADRFVAELWKDGRQLCSDCSSSTGTATLCVCEQTWTCQTNCGPGAAALS